jgi:hypothetical protein
MEESVRNVTVANAPVPFLDSHACAVKIKSFIARCGCHFSALATPNFNY